MLYKPNRDSSFSPAALLCSIFLAFLPAARGQVGAQPIRIIDVHSHVLEPQISRDEEVARFKKAGVAAAAIMSSDPRVLEDLTRRYPGYFIPFVSIAREPNAEGVKLGPRTADELKDLFKSGAVCGWGELGTNGSLAVASIDPGDPARTDPPPTQGVRIAAILLSQNYRKIFEQAEALGVPLNLHLQVEIPEIYDALSRVASLYPRLKVILAHTGWNAPPESIDRLLRAHPNMFVDLSMRIDPLNGYTNPAAPDPETQRTMLASDGTLQPAWRKMIETYPDRFMFAMDITGSSRGRADHIGELVDVARKALSGLPPRTQEAISHSNIERLLSGCAAWHPGQ
jgi:predicted TIM-barrel fold metal-dependent hydrolase